MVTTQLPLCTNNCISSEEYLKQAKEELIAEKKAKYAHLDKWVEWLKKEIPEEFDWYYDTSAPYDSEINVHIKSHKCIGTCFNLRFDEKGKLKASDSHFMGGTHTIQGSPYVDDEEEAIQIAMRQVVEKSIAKECDDSDWEENENKELADLFWKKLLKKKGLDGWVNDRDTWNIREECEKELGIEDE